MRIVGWVALVLACIAAVWVLGLGLRGCQWLGEAEAVAYNEVRPEVLLKKYEWFKNQLAALDSMQARIATYEGNLTFAKQEGYNLSELERRQVMQWRSELSGVVSKYNGMAAEYNAQMAKINWAFTNVGQVPQGGEPLPREVRAYEVR